MMTFRESIRPSADLRNHYNEISRQCRENKEAVIVTVNGREEDVKFGRVAPVQETFDDIRKMLMEEKL